MAVVKVIELVGTSSEGWKEAAHNAVAEAAKTVRNMVGLEVMGQTGVVEGGKIVEYRSNVKVAFVVEEVRG